MAEARLIVQLQLLHADAFGWAVSCSAGDRALAEDVLQDAYLKVVGNAAKREGRSALKTWWFGVIRLTALEANRRKRRRESGLLKLMEGWLLPRSTAKQQEAVEIDEEVARLRALLGTLPARQAEALHLVFYQDLTLAEAAEVMGVSIGSARQHYDRGKKRMRQLLQPEIAHASQRQ